MTHTFVIDEGQRQMIILAIARLSVERPGWDWTNGNLAELLGGRDMFERMKALKLDECNGGSDLKLFDLSPGD